MYCKLKVKKPISINQTSSLVQSESSRSPATADNALSLSLQHWVVKQRLSIPIPGKREIGGNKEIKNREAKDDPGLYHTIQHFNHPVLPGQAPDRHLQDLSNPFLTWPCP